MYRKGEEYGAIKISGENAGGVFLSSSFPLALTRETERRGRDRPSVHLRKSETASLQTHTHPRPKGERGERDSSSVRSSLLEAAVFEWGEAGRMGGVEFPPEMRRLFLADMTEQMRSKRCGVPFYCRRQAVWSGQGRIRNHMGKVFMRSK